MRLQKPYTKIETMVFFICADSSLFQLGLNHVLANMEFLCCVLSRLLWDGSKSYFLIIGIDICGNEL